MLQIRGNRSGRSRRRSRGAASVVAAAALVLGSVVLHPAAQAAGRTEVLCVNSDSDFSCSQQTLQTIIDDAGTTPTRITIASGQVLLTKTLRIPRGADIELGESREVWGSAGDSALRREDGFAGTLIHVEPGSKLTLKPGDGQTLTIGSRGQWQPNSDTTVLVNGELTMEERSSIEGARGMTGFSNEAAGVTVTGKDALFIMNGGEVKDNWRRQGEPSLTQNGAGNIAVTRGGKFVMNDGKVTEGRGTEASGSAYGEAGGIGIYAGGSAEINGGEISNNAGFGGGVLVMSWRMIYGDKDCQDLREHYKEDRASLIFNGGTISDNTAGFGGGGISVFGNAVAEMRGGAILNNTAPNGGGVNAMDLYVWGAAKSWKEIPGDGKRCNMTTDEWSTISPGAFTMTGGKIAGNSASRTGGGVNVVSNKVLLEGGEISGNSAKHQGGGIYVATKTYALQLNNALVTKNESSYIGGGLWACPTGVVELHVTSGGAVIGNTANDFGDDIAHDNLGSSDSQPLWLANRMLGGHPINYYWDNKDARFDADNPGEAQIFRDRKLSENGLHSVVDDRGMAAGTGLQAAQDAAKLLITGYTSYRGAGIGTNGTVIFGTPDIDLDVNKAWLWADSGKTMTAEELAQLGKSSVTLELQRVVGESAVTLQQFKITKDDEWKATLMDLPSTDSDGNAYVYRLVEKNAQGEVIKSVDVTNTMLEAKSVTVENSVEPTPPPTPPTPPETPPTTPPTPSNPPTVKKPLRPGMPSTGC